MAEMKSVRQVLSEESGKGRRRTKSEGDTGEYAMQMQQKYKRNSSGNIIPKLSKPEATV